MAAIPNITPLSNVAHRVIASPALSLPAKLRRCDTHPLRVSDTEATSWVVDAERMLNEMPALPATFEPDWRSIENYSYLFKLTARYLSRLSWLPGTTLQALNRLANRRPLMFTRGYSIYTHDFFFARVSTLAHELREFAGRDNVHCLDIGSCEGLTSCWLLDNVLTGRNSRLVSLDKGPADSAWALTYQHNTGHHRAGRVSIYRGRIHDLLNGMSGITFDIIYVDYLSTTDEFMTIPALAWPLVRRNGVMCIDDYGIRHHPVYRMLLPGCEPEVGLSVFLRQRERDAYLQINNYQVILRKS
jgi:hypothetical protein